MTFVAQPYEQFVDDLLTALTGGMIREEHRFIETEESYSLSSPGAIPFSVKVFGQRNESFALFEGGIDYDYLSNDNVVKWKTEGKLPDERSYFYVNYYLQEGRRRLTDRNPGSVTTILAESFSREFAVLHKQMDLIYRSAFVDLAAGVSLDHVATLLGLTRKDARFATGEALFKRSTPAPGDITIPVGSLVSTSSGQNFETTTKRTLRRGQLSIVAPIRAQVEGSSGRVDAGAIVNVNRPVFGIESTINEEETFFATEKETDGEFRQRIKGTLERAGKATLNAIKYTLIDDISEITEGNVQITERAEVPGFVDVKLGLESTGNADLVRRIEESIFDSRAAGIRVVHSLPSRTISESVKRAEVKQPVIEEESHSTGNREKGVRQEAIPPLQEDIDAMPDGIINLRADVYLRLTERNLSVSQKEKFEDDARNRVVDYIEAIPMGEEIIYNKLIGRIVQPDEISDATLKIGVKNGKTVLHSNLATEGRKAKVNDPIKDVFVRLMEETVFVDILIYVNPSQGSDQTKAPEELHNAVEDAINEIFASAEDKITKDTIKKEVKSLVQTAGFQLIEGNSIVLNAEYEETGLLLNNTDEISLERHQDPELRQPLKIEMKGVLDG